MEVFIHEKQLVICDRDERYRQMMQTYLIKRLQSFEIITFGSLGQVVEYSKKQAVTILLVGEYLYEKGLQRIQARQTFILKEDGTKAIEEYPYIEKYQSMENLISDIFDEYSDATSPDLHIGWKKAKIHAFYSPVGQREQTKAAIALGQCLAEMNKKVLYLNLQPFTGLEEMLQKSFFTDITDLLYFMDKQEDNLVYRLQGIKQIIGDMDYLPSAADYMDLLKITEQEWIALLDKLSKAGEYSEIIVDLSEICQGLHRILERSDSIYSMSAKTEAEKYAIRQYKKHLDKRELSSVLEKTKWIELPQGYAERIINPERLNKTQLGEYMKGLMKENGNRQI